VGGCGARRAAVPAICRHIGLQNNYLRARELAVNSR
jgi:hypothetical protein